MAKSAGLSPLRILIVVHRAQLQLKRKLGDPANFGAHKRRVQDNECVSPSPRRKKRRPRLSPSCAKRHPEGPRQKPSALNPARPHSHSTGRLFISPRPSIPPIVTSPTIRGKRDRLYQTLAS